MREEGAWLGEEKIGVDRGVFSSAHHLRRKSFLLNFRRKLERKVRIGEGVGLMRNYIFALLLFNFFFFFFTISFFFFSFFSFSFGWHFLFMFCFLPFFWALFHVLLSFFSYQMETYYYYYYYYYYY